MNQFKIVIILAACSLWVACGGTASNTATTNSANAPALSNSASNDAQSNSNAGETAQLNGKQLYAESCMICHRDTAKGGETTRDGKKIKPADLTRDKLKTWPDDKWVKDVQEGDPEEGMPAFKDKLKPEEIKAIAAYIKSLG